MPASPGIVQDDVPVCSIGTMQRDVRLTRSSGSLKKLEVW